MVRLSDLKALVALIEIDKVTDDPQIDFWIERDKVRDAGEKDSTVFVTVVPKIAEELGAIQQHRVTACNPAVDVAIGDYSIPLVNKPFFR